MVARVSCAGRCQKCSVRADPGADLTVPSWWSIFAAPYFPATALQVGLWKVISARTLRRGDVASDLDPRTTSKSSVTASTPTASWQPDPAQCHRCGRQASRSTMSTTRSRHPSKYGFRSCGVPDSFYSNALWNVLRQDSDEIRRLRAAIVWLDLAWRNSASRTHDTRILILKSAFEVLLGRGERPDRQRPALSSLLHRVGPRCRVRRFVDRWAIRCRK